MVQIEGKILVNRCSMC